MKYLPKRALYALLTVIIIFAAAPMSGLAGLGLTANAAINPVFNVVWQKSGSTLTASVNLVSGGFNALDGLFIVSPDNSEVVCKSMKIGSAYKDFRDTIEEEGETAPIYSSNPETRRMSVATAVIYNKTGSLFVAVFEISDSFSGSVKFATDSCQITEKDTNVPVTPVIKDAVYSFSSKVRSVKIDDISLNYKKSATLNPVIEADPGVKYTVKYESSNTKVATVDQNGKVTAVKRGSGSADITCTVTDEHGNVVKDTCTISVSLSVGQKIIVYVLFGWIWY